LKGSRDNYVMNNLITSETTEILISETIAKG